MENFRSSIVGENVINEFWSTSSVHPSWYPFFLQVEIFGHYFFFNISNIYNFLIFASCCPFDEPIKKKQITYDWIRWVTQAYVLQNQEADIVLQPRVNEWFKKLVRSTV